MKRTRKIVEQIVGKEEVIDITERREKISLLPQGSLNPGSNEMGMEVFYCIY